ncbi:MAG: ferredoxin family protein [Porticoccaceae bacterium]|jgi:ferredoxin|nr:ferredoxin family protein [Porticoccaceae bacterium]
MTHVVTGNCQRCRFTDCVATCPVDCFHGDDDMLYIDPNECIDCSACVPACPVQAIKSIYDMEEELMEWVAINAQRAPTLPVINSKQEPLPTAEEKRKSLGL